MNSSFSVNGFIDIELKDKDGNVKCKERVHNEVTPVGKQFIMSKSIAPLLNIGGDTLGDTCMENSLFSDVAFHDNNCNDYCGTYQSHESCINNVLLNVEESDKTLMTEESVINLRNPDYTMSDKVVGYASSNIDVIDSSIKEGIIKNMQNDSGATKEQQAAYLKDPFTSARCWEYPAGHATGTINCIGMAPGSVFRSNYSTGLRLRRQLDKTNYQASDSLLATKFCPPGVAPFTTNDTILYNTNGGKWRYTISTGDVSQVDDTEPFAVFMTRGTLDYRVSKRYTNSDLTEYINVLSVLTCDYYYDRVIVYEYDLTNNPGELLSNPMYRCSGSYNSSRFVNSYGSSRLYVMTDNCLYVLKTSNDSSDVIGLEPIGVYTDIAEVNLKGSSTIKPTVVAMNPDFSNIGGELTEATLSDAGVGVSFEYESDGTITFPVNAMAIELNDAVNRAYTNHLRVEVDELVIGGTTYDVDNDAIAVLDLTFTLKSIWAKSANAINVPDGTYTGFKIKFRIIPDIPFSQIDSLGFVVPQGTEDHIITNVDYKSKTYMLLLRDVSKLYSHLESWTGYEFTDPFDIANSMTGNVYYNLRNNDVPIVDRDDAYNFIGTLCIDNFPDSPSEVESTSPAYNNLRNLYNSSMKVYAKNVIYNRSVGRNTEDVSDPVTEGTVKAEFKPMGGLFISLNKWQGNLLSYRLLDTPIEKGESDVLTVTYGYQIS